MKEFVTRGLLRELILLVVIVSGVKKSIESNQSSESSGIESNKSNESINLGVI
jgi:hypothetical protein